MFFNHIEKKGPRMHPSFNVSFVTEPKKILKSALLKNGGNKNVVEIDVEKYDRIIF